jgi:hypothetical protein
MIMSINDMDDSKLRAIRTQPGIVVHIYNPSTQEAKAGGPQVPG